MIVGVYGYQDSGKTTLVEAAIKELVAKGYRVASVKHATDELKIDTEGTDSWRHRKAGSDPVVLTADGETVFMKRPGITLEETISMIQKDFHPDAVIVEGFKQSPYPKVALGDIEPTDGTVLVNPDLGEFVGYVSGEISFERARARLPGLNCSKCGMDCDSLAREIAAGRMDTDSCPELPARRVEIIVDGKALPVGAFVAEITEKTIRGFLSSLKGYSGDGDVEIRLQAPE